MEFFQGEYLARIDFMSKITQYLAMWMCIHVMPKSQIFYTWYQSSYQ